MFVLFLLPMVGWLFLGSSHLAIHVKQASSARGELRRTPLSSTLALRLHSKRPRLVVPHMPLGLLSCRSLAATRKKSAPGPTTLCAPWRAHRRRWDASYGTRPPA